MKYICFLFRFLHLLPKCIGLCFRRRLDKRATTDRGQRKSSYDPLDEPDTFSHAIDPKIGSQHIFVIAPPGDARAARIFRIYNWSPLPPSSPVHRSHPAASSSAPSRVYYENFFNLGPAEPRPCPPLYRMMKVSTRVSLLFSACTERFPVSI